MPIDITQVELYRDDSNPNGSQTFDGWNEGKDDYMCLRTSRFGAVCVHPDILNTAMQSVQGNGNGNLFPSNLPLFRYNDAVKEPVEQCYVMDWEGASELSTNSGTNSLSELMRLYGPQGERAGQAPDFADQLGAMIDQLNYVGENLSDKPSFVVCAESPQDVSYVLTSMIPTVGAFFVNYPWPIVTHMQHNQSQSQHRLAQCRGHYGPGGDGTVLQDPDLQWECNSCSCRDLSDRI